jgi:hypothetical protein
MNTASGFMRRHVFYSVLSRLIDHRLRLRIHDDRSEAYLGGRFLLACRAGGAPRAAGPFTSSTIGTSSRPCAPSPVH